MQFCKDCGGAINFFGNNESDLCSACIQHRKKPNSPAAAYPEGSPDLLAEAILSVEDGKIVLRSKEGWELWTGQPDVATVLQTMLARARRIYEIRLRTGSGRRKAKPQAGTSETG